MAARVREQATYEDVLRAPENMVAELIDGELYTWPRPRGRHGNAQSEILTAIRSVYGIGRVPGGWWIIGEPEVHLGPHAVVPDIGGWRRERMPQLPDSHIFDVAPDWVCEILSPSTARVDRGKKLATYAHHTIPWAWYIDTDARTFEVMRLDDGKWTIVDVFTEGDVVHAEPFPAADINLTLVWGPDPE